MRAATLTWMALRELWISFRFLALLALGLAGGLLVAVGAGPGADGPALLAWSMGGAGVVAAGVAASGLAVERRSGRLAWLAVRSVSRSATLFAWFGSMALPLVVGLAGSVLVGWLVFGAGVPAPVDLPAFTAITVAAGLTGLEALAAGLVAGSLLDPVPAAVVACLATAALLLMGLTVAVEPPVIPAAGLGLLGAVAALDRPLSDGLQAMGIALAATGLLLAIAAAALSRVDL